MWAGYSHSDCRQPPSENGSLSSDRPLFPEIGRFAVRTPPVRGVCRAIVEPRTPVPFRCRTTSTAVPSWPATHQQAI